MQRRKKQADRLTGGERLLLCLVTMFFCATLLRCLHAGPFEQVQSTVQTWLIGSVDLGKAVQAIGQFTEQEHLQAVFHEFFPETTPSDAAADLTPTLTEAAESAAPTDTLAARAASLFPDAVDETVYPIDFACRTPTEGTVSSHFGTRIHPIDGEERFHYGLDIAAPEGTPIRAVADGTVCQTGNNSYGLFAVIDHGGGISTLYAHCSALLVSDGQAVKAGEEIAQVGATGNATGDHLHIEVWRAGKLLNPENYVMLS